jgi:hypothetical protein
MLRELLIERESGVCLRWLDAILADYGPDTAARWRRERDRFANPIGHALTTGLPELLEAVAGGAGIDPGRGSAALEAIVRIRSVQALAPSRAIGFVFMLRDAIREELSAELAGGAHAAALAEIDARIERLAMLAVDVYFRCREQVFRIRQDELKRSVASILRRWHGDEVAETDPELVSLAPPPDPTGRR